MTTNFEYIYTFSNGETIEIQPISPDRYRLYLSKVDKAYPDPEIPMDYHYDERLDEWFEDPWITEAYDRYVDLHKMRETETKARSHFLSIRYILANGVIDRVPARAAKRILNINPNINRADVIAEWATLKCASENEFMDLIDAIVGINMPTESGVLKEMQAFKSVIIEEGVHIPLTEWESKKERRGSVIIPLWAQGLMACKRLNGIITLKEYIGLPGDPRYVPIGSDFPFSKSGIIALDAVDLKSTNAAQEIEMEDKQEVGNSFSFDE